MLFKSSSSENAVMLWMGSTEGATDWNTSL